MFHKIVVVKTNVNECIRTRRSCRAFLDRSVEKEKIEKIIAAGKLSPSACNRRAWYFRVTTGDERKKITDAGGAGFIATAPAGILVCYDSRSDNEEYQDNTQSAAAAAMCMILKAWDIGVQSCYVCNLPPKKWLTENLKIPVPYEPMMFLVLGYAKFIPPRPEKKYGYSPIRKYGRKFAPKFVRRALERKF